MDEHQEKVILLLQQILNTLHSIDMKPKTGFRENVEGNSRG